MMALLSIALPGALAAQSPPKTASLSGVVVSEQGQPLRALVALRTSAMEPVLRGAAKLDGSFNFSQLPPGLYTFCVRIPAEQASRPDQPFLDTCVWEQPQTVLQVLSGQVLTGVRIVAPGVKSKGPLTRSGLLGPSGSFRLDGLHPGRYEICLQAPTTEWLNPCQWGLQPPTVALSDVQPSQNLAIKLKRGAVVRVRIDDPGKLLEQNEGKTAGAHLLLGVGTDALWFHAAPIVSKDPTGRDHQVVVPFDRQVNLTVFSPLFELGDSSGSSLEKSGSIIPILVRSGQVPIPIHLSVTGTRK